VEVETSFGRWVQRRRKALDLTQEELAQRAGCAAETLRKIEADARRPSRSMAESLADALEIPEANHVVFIKAARAELAVDRLKPPTQDLPQVALVPTKTLSSEAVALLLTQITSEGQTKVFDGRCPYKGLDAFEEEDADLFFGREQIVSELVRRVEESRAMFVMGPSGSGKSSLVRAGLIPALKRGEIKTLHSERWLYETIKPGRDPITELARAVSSMAGTTNAGGEVRAKALKDESIFTQWCQIALRESRDKRAIIFIDQFEEIFTQASEEEERSAFLNMLTHAATAESSRVILLFAMRSDFVLNCATYPQLNALFNQQSIQIGAMEINELVRAIAQPAVNVGLHMDHDLVEQIIDDMQGEPGALPLMQFALKDLFDAQQAKGEHINLNLSNYLQRGGIHKSLERHADNAFAKLYDNERELARFVFSRLIEIGQGTQDTRRTSLLSEIIPSGSSASDVELVVQKLADARLITIDEQAGVDLVTISHEKLIEAWPWLKELVNENRDIIALQNEIARDAIEWYDAKRDISYLYTGARLASAYEELASKKLALRGIAYEFLLAGQARRQRNRFALIAGISTIIILLIGAVIVFRNQATRSANIATTAQAAEGEAIAQKATAQSESQARSTQQSISEANFQHAEALRLAAEASNLISSQGIPEQIALLSLRSMNIQYTPQGDAALSGAATLIYPEQVYVVSQSVFNVMNLINGVAFSPDAKHIVTGSGYPYATLWDAVTGEEVRRLVGHGASLTGVAYSSDGKYVLTGSWDKTAIMWEIVNGKQVHRFIGHTDTVWSVTFSPDGDLVLTGGHDGTARLWDAATGKVIFRFISQAVWVQSVAFSPNGNYALLGTSDGAIELWNVQTGMEMRKFMGHTSSVNSVAFSPDGKFILAGGDDHVAKLWDAATGTELQSFIGHTNAIQSVAFSPDGKYIFSGSDDGTARKWDPRSGQELQRYTGPATVGGNVSMPIAVSKAGNLLLTASSEGETRLWNINATPKLPVFKNTDDVNGLAFSTNGRYVLTGDSNGVVRMWDAATGTELQSFIGHTNAIQSVAFSPNGKYILTGGWDHTVRLWDIETDKELRKFIGPATEVHSVAFSPDGKYVAAGALDGVWLWSTETGKEVWQPRDVNRVLRIAFSPDGKYVASVDDGNSQARLWDVSTGKPSFSTYGFNAFNTVAFSADGKQLLTASDDYTVRLWSIRPDMQILQFTGHTANVLTAVFSPNGKYVATASADGTARLWDAQTGQELRRFIGHTAVVENVVFSPDGKYLLTGSDDGTARLWDVDYQTTIEYLCAVLWRDFTDDERIKYNITDNAPTCPKQ
jgi:WD40 repeat protein/transcriptional regulator with XRE-family HTH domain